ncbi:MAG: type II secretion system F family protein [Candidatus Zambryskibacteria bacterium]|nr:type II secretion system F family protein [Candidatus Zambryskibacteria bacterium]
MLFSYKTINRNGIKQEGEVEAFSMEAAISALQNRGLIISSIKPIEEGDGDILKRIPFFNKVSNREIVILSRQMSTLFEAQVSALKVFKLLGTESENPALKKHLLQIVDDLQSGSSISGALSKHPEVFSNFYINMVKSGEESGHLDQVFSFLADYLDRTYEVSSKAKHALIYPAFIIFTFIAVMVIMFTVIVPKIGLIIKESAQEVPFYTQIVFWVSDFFVAYWMYMVFGLIALIGGLFWYGTTKEGKRWISNARLYIPYVGDLYRKLYLSRFSDNLSTMVLSGIPMLKAIQVTASVIDNEVYKEILEEAEIKIRGGQPLSASLKDNEEIPNILTQMIKVGEETGELGNIMKTMSKFYQREVMAAVDTLVSMIEPIMIVMLGVGVGVLLASVLMPIYNIASGI